MNVARLFTCFCLLAISAYLPAQILNLAELNTTQVQALDRAHTVLLIPNGILEEHGPYLPSYTDGYWDEALTDKLAHALAARPGWKVVIFPAIPLGTSPANIIGKRYIFPGSFTVSHTTMRAVFMDLADSFGEQGFRHIFLIDSHGGPYNSVALDAASDYFHDTYGGHMVHLLGTMQMFECCDPMKALLTPKQIATNGLSVHADAVEQSQILFVRPDLAPTSYKQAVPHAGSTFDELSKAASAQDWPGYLGAPAYASTALGKLYFDQQLAAMTRLATEILDGKTDPAKLPRYGATMMPQTADIEAGVEHHEAEAAARQQRWLAAHPETTSATKP